MPKCLGSVTSNSEGVLVNHQPATFLTVNRCADHGGKSDKVTHRMERKVWIGFYRKTILLCGGLKVAKRSISK